MDPSNPQTDKKADYLLHILEAIGAPLMSAITDAAPTGQDNPQNEAQTMAALLGKTVEASIDLGNIMQINPAEAQDDTLRVALAGLAGPLVAGQYKHRQRVPESPEIKKITSALQAVLTFSDNFTPTPQTVERLKNLEAQGQASDTYQTQIQYMQAFIPVVEAIAQFPFGQAEAKLIMDVSDRIIKRSVELREALLPNESDEGVQKLVELGFVRALGQLYSACHKAETEKVTGMDQDSQAGGLSIDPVWKAFDMRTAMVEALAAKMSPASAGQSSAAAGGGPAVAATAPVTEQAAPPPAAPPVQPPAETPPAAPPPVQPPAQTQPPAPPETPTTPPPPAAPPTEQQGQGAAAQNPMAMFSKTPDAGSQDTGQPATPPPPAAPAAPPAQPPAETPPAAPPAQPPPAQTQPPVPPETPAAPPPPPVQPPAQPPAAPPQEQSGEGESQGDSQGQGGSPMSFFKKDE